MKVSLFGLGYVGCVSAACFARAGHRIVGVDVNPLKVDLLNSGQSPIVEKDVGAFIMETVVTGRLRATTDPREAVLDSDLSIVCVGTPSRTNGSRTTNSLPMTGTSLFTKTLPPCSSARRFTSV